MFDFSFENIISSNFINFCILLVAFVIIAWKMNISEKLDNLKQTIIQRIKNSDDNKQQAITLLAQTRLAMKNFDSELEQITNNAQKTAQNMTEQIENDAKLQAEKIQVNVASSIENELLKIQNELQSEITSDCIDSAKNKIIERLTQDEKLHSQLIDECIDNLDKVVLL